MPRFTVNDDFFKLTSLCGGLQNINFWPQFYEQHSNKKKLRWLLLNLNFEISEWFQIKALLISTFIADEMIEQKKDREKS